MLFLISDIVSTGSPQYFDVTTFVDKTMDFTPGTKVYVKDVTGNSPNNSSIFTVGSSTFPALPGITRIFPVEVIPASMETEIGGGDVYYLSGGVLTVHFTDDTLKSPIDIPPNELNYSLTSLGLIGRGALNYGEVINENLIRILENFASDGVAPSNPTIGQMWWDHQSLAIRVWTGSNWQSGLTIGIGDSLVLLDGESVPTGNEYHIRGGGGPNPDVGIDISPAIDPPAGSSLFRVLNASGDEMLRVERDGEVQVSNALAVDGVAGNSYFLGKLVVGTNTITAGYEFQVTGDTNIIGDLDVSGTTTLTSTTNVSGTTYLNGGTAFNGPTPVVFNTIVDFNNSSISNMLDPVNPQDGATKNYVDVEIAELDTRKLDRISNLPVTEVGHLVPEYIPSVVGDESFQCCIPWAENAQVFWLRESTGIYVGLVPQYNGEQIRVHYVYSKTGRMDVIVFTGYEYRPAALAMSSNQYVTRIGCQTPDGFQCFVQTSGGGETSHWITHNGTMDPADHTAETLDYSISASGMIKVPEFGLWFKYINPNTNGDLLAIGVYDSDGLTLIETLPMINWKTDITYVDDAPSSPVNISSSFLNVLSYPNIFYSIAGSVITISSILDVFAQYNPTLYKFGVNCIGDYETAGSPNSWTFGHTSAPHNLPTLPYVFDPLIAPTYPIFDVVYNEEGQDYYNGRDLIHNVCIIDETTVLIAGRFRTETVSLGGQVLNQLSKSSFLNNVGKEDGYWVDGDPAKYNHTDGFQQTFITNATPLGTSLQRAGWASPNDIFFTSYSFMPNSGDTASVGPYVERSGWTVRVNDPANTFNVDKYTLYGPLTGYTGDFIEHGVSIQADSNIVGVYGWDDSTVSLTDTGEFVLISSRIEDVVLTPSTIIHFDSYDYVTKIQTPDVISALFLPTLAGITAEIELDPDWLLTSANEYRYKPYIIGGDSAYTPGSGNVLIVVTYTFVDIGGDTRFRFFTATMNNTTFTRVSPITEAAYGVYGVFVDSGFLDQSVIRGAGYYTDTALNKKYALVGFPSMRNVGVPGDNIKIIVIEISSDNAGTPGNLNDWELVLDSSTGEENGFTLSMHDLYGPCITATGTAVDQNTKVIMKYQDFTSTTSYAARMTACWNGWLTSNPKSFRGILSLRPPVGFNFYSAEIPIFIGGTYRVAPSAMIDLQSSFPNGSPPDYINNVFYSYAENTSVGPSIVIKGTQPADTLSSAFVGTVTTDTIGLASYTFEQNLTRIDAFKLQSDPSPSSVVVSLPNGKIDSKWLNIPVAEELGATYTLSESDENVHIKFNSAVSQTVTVPTNAVVMFPIGTEIPVSRHGIGAVAFTPDGGVTINSADGYLSLRAQYSEGVLLKTATDTWLLSGDLA